jgi:hypothetical protein
VYANECRGEKIVKEVQPRWNYRLLCSCFLCSSAAAACCLPEKGMKSRLDFMCTSRDLVHKNKTVPLC